ncbi:MAG TPA: hypothetical protein VG942_07430, partial [Hyphomonadaceae bacterium]|nr:hypothetical protein [Hyphomonadaceae bacterium]
NVRVLLDETRLASETLGVSHTGEAFVIDPRIWSIVYRGPVDDRFTTSTPDAAARRQPVRDALDTLIAGKPITPTSYETGGVAIAYPPHVAATYTGDIAPILRTKCISCHTEGGIAPFAMDDYAGAKQHAPMMRSALRTQRMPPFYADRHIGAWKHDLSLTNDEIRTLVHWVEAGAPRGDGDDAMRAKTTSPEWPLGQPDIVLTLPVFDVPIEGVLLYRTVNIPNPLKTTKWLRALAILPGDRGAVHHVLADYQSGIGEQQIGSYARGATSKEWPDDAGVELAPGGVFKVRTYYVPDGVARKDVTRIGLYFRDKAPAFPACSAVISARDLKIAPGKADQKVEATLTLAKPSVIFSVMPIAHDRGARAGLSAVYPDGREELLLSLPRFDFNWLRDYELAEPKALPAGTKLVAHFVYDNSDRNQLNPDSKATVTAGDAPNGEAAEMRIGYRPADASSGCAS